MSDQPMSEAVAFFYEHAGYSWDPNTETQEQGRRRCAEALAQASAAARPAGLWFEWESAPFEPGREAAEWVCTCRNSDPDEWPERSKNWDILASLGGIDSPPGSPYARVIEAELALEALAVLKECEQSEGVPT